MSSPAKLLLLMMVVPSVAFAQNAKADTRLEKHGTCSITATAPFGAAFIIDSRVTSLDSMGHIVSQAPGCKVLLARPTILLAGVGLEDTTGRAGHWNSLDAASDALKSLPDHPTVAQLNAWSFKWGETLIQHFRQGNETPSMRGEVANVLLVTKIDNHSYYLRTSVEWNGESFDKYIYGQPLDESIPQLHYSGACRDFARVADGEGRMLGPKFSRTRAEEQRFQYWGNRKIAAKSVDDLADAVYGLESLSTDMDRRFEGEHAVIAPPYAAAEWQEGEPGWRTRFNPECASSTP